MPNYSDDEGAAYELSHLLESEGQPDETHTDPIRSASFEQRSEASDQMHQTRMSSSTEYLDGLRGLAAVWVFVQHFMPAFTGGLHENGFGQDRVYLFVSLPYVRLFFGSGGNTAVVIFFVLSGYVLSISPLRKLKQEKPSEVRRGLLGALIRRPIRLYVPPFAVSFTHAVLLHVPGLFLQVPWLKPEEKTLGEEIAWWWEKTTDYFSFFRDHGSNLFAYPYNVAMWTLPIEMNGSVAIYGTLAILSLGLRGPDPRVPTMVVVLIFFSGAVMLQHFWAWYVVCFLFGMMLAMIDTWAVGTELRSMITCRSWLKIPHAMSKSAPSWAKQTPAWAKDMHDRWSSFKLVKLLPTWLRRRLPTLATRAHTEPKCPTIWPHVCLFVGFYLLSEPAHAGDKNFSLKTPGWVTLTRMIPNAYDELRYYRYWQTWGALLGIYGVLRIRWLQWFFSTRFLRFLGFVSFMLYLVHLPFFRVFPDRFNNLIGYNGDPNDFGTFWDKSWEIPDVGPVGMTSRFWVSMAISFPTTLFVAWLATISIDQPSVQLSKLVTRLIGLDTPKPRSQVDSANKAAESTVIFSTNKDTQDLELQSGAHEDEHQHQMWRGGDEHV